MTEQTFIEQVNINEQALYAFANKLTRDENKAKDLVQETLIKAFRAKDKFDPNRNFKSWAFTILKNTFISDYRRKQRGKIVSLPVEEFAHLKYGNIKDIKSEEYLAKLRTSIEKLSLKSKEPIKLYLRGFKYEEISNHLSIPIGTVKSRMNFAKTKLRRLIMAS